MAGPQMIQKPGPQNRGETHDQMEARIKGLARSGNLVELRRIAETSMDSLELLAVFHGLMNGACALGSNDPREPITEIALARFYVMSDETDKRWVRDYWNYRLDSRLVAKYKSEMATDSAQPMTEGAMR